MSATQRICANQQSNGCHSEAEREANIARNRALIAQLDIDLDIPRKPSPKPKAKPAPSTKKRVKRVPAPVVPLRQSTRLRKTAPDPNESPAKKRKREVRGADCHAIASDLIHS